MRLCPGSLVDGKQEISPLRFRYKIWPPISAKRSRQELAGLVLDVNLRGIHFAFETWGFMSSKIQKGVIDAPQKGLIFSRIHKNVLILMFSSGECVLIHDFRSKVRKKIPQRLHWKKYSG